MLVDDLVEFLARLGLTIEERSDRIVHAARRTALRHEKSRFIVGDRNPPRRSRGATLILPNDSAAPESYRGPWFYFDDFLDRTIQSDKIANEARTLAFDPGVKSQLEQVFVPQRIAEAGSPKPQDAVKYFFDEWLPSDHSRLLVALGPAGYGKTLLSFELARRLGESHLESHRDGAPPRQPLPFLVPFGHFRRVAEFEGMILTSLQRRGITDFTAGAFAYLVARKRIVLFLDGFDELLEERPTEAQKNLREFIETLRGNSKVVITARSTFFRTSLDVADFLEHDLTSDQLNVVDLQPFDSSQRSIVVQKLSPNQATINRVNQIVDAPGIREAMGSPLLLRETVVALVEGDVRITRTPSRRELFARLEESVYERERRRHSHLFSDQVQRDMLQILGAELLRENLRGFDMDSVRVAASEAIGDGQELEGDLEKLADHHFLTVDHESEEARFNHQVFREYFQALSLLDALERGDKNWAVTVLSRRPVPEEVAEFFAELGETSMAEALIECMARPAPSSQLFVNNVAAMILAHRNTDIFIDFLRHVDPGTPLSLRVDDIDLGGVDFSKRLFDNVDFAQVRLVGASFAHSILHDSGFHECDVTDANFEGAEFQSATFDYHARLYGTAPILKELSARRANCGSNFEERLETLQADRRTEIRDIVKGRFRRFYVPGQAGPHGSRWDVSIKDKTLLSGLDSVTRSFAAGKIVPEMLRLDILSKWRQHNQVIYRLEDRAKDDARTLIEHDEETGVVTQLIDRLT